MKCKVVSISHKPTDWEKKALDFYFKQIPSNLKLSFVDVRPIASKTASQDLILQNESIAIIKHIEVGSYIILWDREGDSISSTGLAKLFQEKIDLACNITMIIGGSYGVASNIVATSDLILSASNLTFPHRLFKILLMEQIFRASAINRNHPYHK